MKRDLPMPVLLGAGVTPAGSRQQNSGQTYAQSGWVSCHLQCTTGEIPALILMIAKWVNTIQKGAGKLFLTHR